MAESELFGHEKGAFTTAYNRKKGLIELAENGTLLLNEIGDMPLDLQSKLLTFLDTREFRRVGGEQIRKSNARIIAATNKDLQQEVENKTFRLDLFHRLNVFPVRIPSLRERKEDIPILVGKLMTAIVDKQTPKHSGKITPDAMSLLVNHNWPGNVRELQNILERAVIRSQEGPITPEILKLGGLGESPEVQPTVSDNDSAETPDSPSSPDKNISEAVDRFRRLSSEEQARHLIAMLHDVCGGEAGTISCIAEMVCRTPRWVRDRIRKAGGLPGASGNPGKGAADRIKTRLEGYLIKTFGV